MLTIHNFERGGRGLRIAWLCEEMGLPYALRLFGYPPPVDYPAMHPLGNVPFLEDGEVRIHESVAIALYIASRYGPTPLLPPPAQPDYARVLELTVFSEASFGGLLNTLMGAYFIAPEAEKQNWSVRGATMRCEQQLSYLEARLGDRPYFVGDDLTVADIAIVTALGVWRGALGKDIPPKLSDYRDRLTQRPAYQRAAKANGNT